MWWSTETMLELFKQSELVGYFWHRMTLKDGGDSIVSFGWFSSTEQGAYQRAVWMDLNAGEP